MAEEEDLQSTAGTSDQEQPAGPQFALQRIYLKDSSFESPGSPGVFQGQWTPKINFDIKSKHEKLQDDFFEVILVLVRLQNLFRDRLSQLLLVFLHHLLFFLRIIIIQNDFLG